LASFDQKLSGLTANFLEREVKKHLTVTSPLRRRRSSLDCSAICEEAENSQFPFIPTWGEVTYSVWKQHASDIKTHIRQWNRHYYIC